MIQREPNPADGAAGPLAIRSVFEIETVRVQAALIQAQWESIHSENPLHTDALIQHELATINQSLPEGLSIESPDATHITGDRTHLRSGWYDRAWQQYKFPEESLAPNWSWETYMSTFTQQHINAWQAQGNEGFPPHH